MKRIFTITLLIVLCASFVCADSVYSLYIPNVFVGDVTYSGNSSMDLEGYEIKALVGGQPTGVLGLVGADNEYEVDVQWQGEGKDIIFYVGGVKATPSATYVMAGFTELDLEIDDEPTDAVCGNGVVEAGEQCDINNFGSFTCEMLTLDQYSGSLICGDDCNIDLYNCTTPIVAPPTPSSTPSSSDSGDDGDTGSSSRGGGSAPIVYNEPEKKPVNIIPSEDNSKITGAAVGTNNSGKGLIALVVGIVIIAAALVVINVGKRKAPKQKPRYYSM